MLRILFSLLLLAAPLFSQSLTGRWQSVFVTPEGQKRITSLWLHAGDKTLTGYQS